jgi:hypothetical protein
MNIREEIEQKKKELAELEAREQEELAAKREQIRKEYGADFKALNDAVEAFNKKHGKDYILAFPGHILITVDNLNRNEEQPTSELTPNNAWDMVSILNLKPMTKYQNRYRGEDNKQNSYPPRK